MVGSDKNGEDSINRRLPLLPSLFHDFWKYPRYKYFLVYKEMNKQGGEHRPLYRHSNSESEL